MEIDRLAETIKEAFAVARSGRPGPVLIDIPKDIQSSSIEFSYPKKPVMIPGVETETSASKDEIELAVNMIASSERPVILAGHGILLSGATNEVVNLAEICESAFFASSPVYLLLYFYP